MKPLNNIIILQTVPGDNREGTLCYYHLNDNIFMVQAEGDNYDNTIYLMTEEELIEDVGMALSEGFMKVHVEKAFMYLMPDNPSAPIPLDEVLDAIIRDAADQEEGE